MIIKRVVRYIRCKILQNYREDEILYQDNVKKLNNWL